MNDADLNKSLERFMNVRDAAPDMLAALKRVSNVDGYICHNALAQVRAAIAKAEDRRPDLDPPAATHYPRIRRLTAQDHQALVDNVNAEWRRKSAYEQAMYRFMTVAMETKRRWSDVQADKDDEESEGSR